MRRLPRRIVEIQPVKYFLTVADELHFGRAAERLHLSTSAVSRAVKELEQELRTPLLIRRYHRLELTAAGQVLAARARAVLADFERIRAEILALSNTVPRVLRLGAPQPVPPPLLDTVVAAAEKVCPGIVVEVELQPSAGVLTELRAGRLDVAVNHLPTGYDDLVSAPIAAYRYHIAMRADDPLATRPSLSFSDLADRTFVTMASTTRPPASVRLHNAMQAAGIHRFSPLTDPDPVTRAWRVRRTGAVTITLAPETGGTARVFDDPAFAVIALRDAPLVSIGITWREPTPGQDPGFGRTVAEIAKVAAASSGLVPAGTEMPQP
jgi:DNA-binding transcriptional LysR family regulator